MNDDNQLGFLDILAVISFTIQMQNQSKIFSISDIQKELHKVITEVHEHLEIQDNKIDYIIKRLEEM